MNAYASSDQFYPAFKDDGLSLLLVALNGLKAAIGLFGIVLNVSLVAVTVLSRSLHGTCNILLAIDSFGFALYLLSPMVSLGVALTGLNFIPMSTCFALQSIPMLGLNISFGTMLFISTERLLSICFPFWFSQLKPTLYLPALVTFTLLIAISNLYRLYLASAADMNKMVMCYLTDCYRGDAGQQIYMAGLLTIFVCIACYLGIWLQMRRKLAQGKVDSATRRLFKSLVVIISIIVCGWMLDIMARLVLPRLSMAPLAQLVLSSFLSNCAFLAASSNAPVLYAFSLRDYRSAYNAWLNRLIASMGLKNGTFHLNTVAVGTTSPAPAATVTKSLKGCRSVIMNDAALDRTAADAQAKKGKLKKNRSMDARMAWS